MSPFSFSVAEDDGTDDQLPTPPDIAFPKATVVPGQSYGWGASATEQPSLYRITAAPETHTMTPPDSEDDQGSSDEPRQSFPPPIPPKSPLRRGASMRTMSDVSFPSPLDLRRPSTA